ncbi:beta-L-arabinofuranosidase domain-containing protein [Carboxylicivirga caseinilyticus]|uniref:beta-L-arabinofuranosidase domain-containing protein n=1 Tax=Carboxylicivirga caseinilyticus TaxID=3417572 RepID=UPI003D34FBB7|nr:glycoside hydrolase family 127 protein [Marinilabiliaceae bacterium A049]
MYKLSPPRIKKKHTLVVTTLLLLISMSCNHDKPKAIDESVKPRVELFSIKDVTLLEGPFYHATELGKNTLLAYEPDRFLARFRTNAGLEAKAEHYEGWEGESLAGHSLGHYMTAISQMYQTTGDKEFLNRANYIVDELALCQDQSKSGFIGAFENTEKILTEEVAKGQIKAQGFNLNGLWSPFYTVHKIMDGLFHVYKLCDNKTALEIDEKLARWVGQILKDLNEEQLQEMLHCEFGGMPETLLDLYGETGDTIYLHYSKKFRHKAIIDPIIENNDILAGKHCNTQVPKFLALARSYELTGDTSDYKGAINFWDMMVHHHAYVAGDFDNYEYLYEPDQLNDQLSNSTAETCCVYNMLKLSRHLFQWNPSVEILDYYERALINHILSSQHPEDGRVIYHLSLDMGGFKVYEDPHDFTCCVGSGMENHAKYAQNIYYHSEDELIVGQFIASEVNWKEKGFSLKQTTLFPEEEGTTLEVITDQAEIKNLSLKVRYPAWASQGFKISINGKTFAFDAQHGSFINLGDTWRNGDLIKIDMPFNIHTESMPDNKNRLAIFNGPVLLAGILGPENDPKIADPLYVPVLMTKDANPASWLVKSGKGFNTFKLTDIAQPRAVELQPFYRTHNCTYTVYWDSYTPNEWKHQQKKYKEEQAKKKELELKTIDLFRLGEMQPERDHNFKEEASWVGEYKSRKYREIPKEGFASFEMAVDPSKKNSLVFEYWGGFAGSHTFDITVEGQVIATENITNMAPGKFINVTYEIPEQLIENKNKIKIELLPHDGHRAGPVFAVRTIKS